MPRARPKPPLPSESTKRVSSTRGLGRAPVPRPRMSTRGQRRRNARRTMREERRAIHLVREESCDVVGVQGRSLRILVPRKAPLNQPRRAEGVSRRGAGRTRRSHRDVRNMSCIHLVCCNASAFAEQGPAEPRGTRWAVTGEILVSNLSIQGPASTTNAHRRSESGDASCWSIRKARARGASPAVAFKSSPAGTFNSERCQETPGRMQHRTSRTASTARGIPAAARAWRCPGAGNQDRPARCGNRQQGSAGRRPGGLAARQ